MGYRDMRKDGRGFHCKGVTVPDTKDMVTFVVVCANQVSVNWDAVTWQRVSHHDFTAAEVSKCSLGLCADMEIMDCWTVFRGSNLMAVITVSKNFKFNSRS